MSAGWIKIHRQLLQHPRFSDSEWLSVWIYLLLKATHQPYKVNFDGRIIELKPGQLVTGRKAIAEATGVHESKVKRILAVMKTDQQIDQLAGAKGSVITVLNWARYQNNDQQNGQPLASERPANDQPVTTNKNGRPEDGKNKRKNTHTSGAEPQTVPSIDTPKLLPLSEREGIKRAVFDFFVKTTKDRLEYAPDLLLPVDALLKSDKPPTLEDCKLAIKSCWRDWHDSAAMRGNIRLSTIFKPGKFWEYVANGRRVFGTAADAKTRHATANPPLPKPRTRAELESELRTARQKANAPANEFEQRLNAAAVKRLESELSEAEG